MPREAGSPHRQPINNTQELVRFIDYNDGLNDCFITTYPLNNTIDKIFLDFDSQKGLCTHKQAFEDSKRVYEYLSGEGYRVVKLASGKKGVHLHTLFSPWRYKEEIDGKLVLWRATVQLLTDVFGELAFGSEINLEGKSVRVVYAVKENNRILGCDPSVFGDVSRLCRLPNTRRPPENVTWCTWLPDEFVDMDWYDVVMWSRMAHSEGPIKIPRTTINKIRIDDSIQQTEVKINNNNTIFNGENGHENIILKTVLRTCLYKHIMVANPVHIARVAATIDLLRFWSISDISTIYSTLNWADWDPQVTIEQIHSCKKYREFSCSALRKNGICMYEFVDQCPDRTRQIENEGVVA